jgi:hypothetical protein
MSQYSVTDEGESLGTTEEIRDVAEAPAWLQLGIIVSDGSSSMTLPVGAEGEEIPGLAPETKAAAANRATLGFLDRMQAGRKKANFSLGWISFNDSVTDTIGPMSADHLRDVGAFDPTAKRTGGTQIWTGLDAAARMIEDWRANPPYSDLPMSAVVVLLTDGEDGGQAKTVEVANRLKGMPNTVLAGCFFATKGGSMNGADFLQRIVTSPRHYKNVYTAEDLRDFFHASVTTAIGQDD